MNSEKKKSKDTASPALQDERVLPWLKLAEGVAPKIRLDVSVDVLLEDALHLAASARRLWQPTEARAGLESAGPSVPADLPEQIASLGVALQLVHDAILSAVDDRADDRGLWDLGRLMLMDLRAVLVWTAEALSLDEPLHDPWKFDEEPADVLVLATEMEALILTAREHWQTVQSVTSFDEDLVTQAESLILKIRQLPANNASTSPSMQALLVAHRQLATLLQARLRLLHSAARYVFRGQPSLLAEMQGEAQQLSAADQPQPSQAVSRRYAYHPERHWVFG